jgi:hypothetical protein
VVGSPNLAKLEGGIGAISCAYDCHEDLSCGAAINHDRFEQKRARRALSPERDVCLTHAEPFLSRILRPCLLAENNGPWAGAESRSNFSSHSPCGCVTRQFMAENRHFHAGSTFLARVFRRLGDQIDYPKLILWSNSLTISKKTTH